MIEITEMNTPLTVEAERLGKTFTFDSIIIKVDKEVKKLIRHADLERIAREYGFEFWMEVVPSNNHMVIVKGGMNDTGEISKVAPWTVQRMGEVNLYAVNTEYARIHPYTVAEQIAFDRCVIQMLGLPSKTYSDNEFDLKGIPTATATAPSEPSEEQDEELFPLSVLEEKSAVTKQENEEKKTRRGRRKKAEKEPVASSEQKDVTEETDIFDKKGEEYILGEENVPVPEPIKEVADIPEDAFLNMDDVNLFSDIVTEEETEEMSEEEEIPVLDVDSDKNADADKLARLEGIVIEFGNERGKTFKEASGKFLSFLCTISNGKYADIAQKCREYCAVSGRDDIKIPQ